MKANLETKAQPVTWRSRLSLAAISRQAALGRILAAAAPIVVIVGGWWVLTTVLDRTRIFPPPDVIWSELLVILFGGGELGSSYSHIAATLYRLTVAFTAAMVIGTLLGVLAGRIRGVFSLLENLVWISMAVPSIVWVFIFAVTMGLTDLVPITAVAALLTPGVIINVAEGSKSIPSDILQMSDSYKAGKLQRLVDVYLPFLVPYVSSSARVAFALGIKLIVVAEVVGIPSGVGFEIKYWYDRLVMAPMIAWGIVMITIGFIVDRGLFATIERRVGRWKSGQEITVGRTV